MKDKVNHMPLALWGEVKIMICLLIELIFLEYSVYDGNILGSWDSLRQKKKIPFPQGFYNLAGKLIVIGEQLEKKIAFLIKRKVMDT